MGDGPLTRHRARPRLYRGRLGWCSATRNMVVAETAAWYRDENERKGV